MVLLRALLRDARVGASWVAAALVVLTAACTDDQRPQYQRKEGPRPMAADATAAKQTRTAGARPPLPGDVTRGWRVFTEHCVECHGSQRRGDGEGKRRTLKRPADLRDPVFLANRSDDDLANVITLGGRWVGKSKSMPAFAAELTEREVMDVIALMRGDSIYLEECFPDATHFVEIRSNEEVTDVLAAYTAGPRTGRPKVVAREDLPAEAEQIGLVLFAEMSLPGAGITPVAFVADSAGVVTGLRVALPPPDNIRAQEDLEATLIRRIPRLPQLAPTLEAGAARLARAAASGPAPTLPKTQP